MTEFRNPFSLYDFLGYLLPGAFLLFGAEVLMEMGSIGFKANDIIEDYGRINAWVAFIVVAYIAGHGINYLSSITIEKYSVWMYGYPSYYLLGGDFPKYIKRIKKSELDKFSNEVNRKSKLLSIIIKIRERLYESKCKPCRWISTMRLVSSFWRIFLWFFIFPVSITDLIVGKLGRFNRSYLNPLDQGLSASINSKIEKFLTLYRPMIYQEEQTHQKDKKTDYFRTILHYYYEKYPAHRAKLDNYVALYGLTRTLSLIFSFFGLFFTAYVIMGIAPITSWFTLVILYSISYLFYAAFMKFYRRYTLEGLMCLEIDRDLLEDSDKRHQLNKSIETIQSESISRT